ncbi:glycoside hydrolase family 15 protein [Kitasatospora cineracea]|uniref:GH15 family glucan-1,4-alpha-glucosidase n=1 Tax=Kitasatospora cineracea TaxID=88074 RepID=A0A8G1X938_9ACTN|nr:glycoside hydrolase family 15 protein [Kitasatospora cineracea]ROR37455.1 GH15 family glucan-1,4-alpha-glucosidase [Kitasatospora cineracea]
MGGRIEDYALLSDLQTAALVGRDGSVDWLCLPRFDSPSCFAALLGTPEHGAWRIAPVGAGDCTGRRYLGDTLVLESRWRTPDGEVKVTDLMPHRDRAPRLVRIVEGVSGAVPVRGELRLRFHHGRVDPWVRRTEHHRVAVAGPDAAWLRVPPGVHTYGANGAAAGPGTGAGLATVSEFTALPGVRVPFVLTWQPSHLATAPRTDPEALLAATLADWRAWAGQLSYRGEWRDAVLRSLLTLKALAYEPTGGIVAAPTSSLPEAPGGERNWDYRFCWLRDSAMTLSALLRGGFRQEAAAWRKWLLRAVAGDPSDVQAVYGVAGERGLPETEADWLPGHLGSRPVRFGNAAVGQLQLDVYGEVVDTLDLALRAGLPMERQVWGLLRTLLGSLAARWREPDEGLWEVRCGRRQFTHSKVMAWVAADRAVRMAEATGLPAPLEQWRALRDAVHAEVCERAVDPRRKVFVRSYGATELDAATLFVATTGFLPPDDERVVRTVEAVRRDLDHGGLVRRYRAGAADGLPGSEGAFLACSFWLADALAVIGRRAEARELFVRTASLANDLGLLSEQWDPPARRQLGNTPQAFTHVALVNTAFRLGS